MVIFLITQKKRAVLFHAFVSKMKNFVFIIESIYLNLIISSLESTAGSSNKES
jgi:hypothetical protein